MALKSLEANFYIIDLKAYYHVALSILVSLLVIALTYINLFFRLEGYSQPLSRWQNYDFIPTDSQHSINAVVCINTLDEDPSKLTGNWHIAANNAPTKRVEHAKFSPTSFVNLPSLSRFTYTLLVDLSQPHLQFIPNTRNEYFLQAVLTTDFI